VLHGRKLYVEVFDVVPPGIFITYGLAELVTGYGPQEIYLLNVVAGVVILLGVFAAARRAGGGVSGGLWAAAFWTVISGDPRLMGNLPGREVFINACLIWSFVLLFHVTPKRLLSWPILGIGLLWAAASLYKQSAVAAVAALAIGYVLVATPGADRRYALWHMGVCAGVGALVWAGVFTYFCVVGRFGAFWEAVFVALRESQGNTLANVLEKLEPSNLVPDFLFFMAPLACLSVAGVMCAFRTGLRPSAGMISAFCAGAAVFVAVHFGFAPYRWQLWLPVLSVSGGWSLATLAGSVPSRFVRPVYATGVAILLLLVRYEGAFYRLPPDEWTRLAVGDGYASAFTTVPELVQEINTLLLPDETFCQLANEPQLYFYSGRRSPTKFTVFWAASDSKYSTQPRFAKELVADFDRERPELVVITVWSITGGDIRKEPMRSILANYRPLPGNPQRGPYVLLCLKGGKLEKRLSNLTAPTQ
jgi:hypothetical protein